MSAPEAGPAGRPGAGPHVEPVGGNVAIFGERGRDEQDRRFFSSVPSFTGGTVILVATSAAADPGLPAALHEACRRAMSQVTPGGTRHQLWIAVSGLSRLGPNGWSPAQQLAEEFPADVLVPENRIALVPGGALFAVPEGDHAWRLFRSGTLARPFAARFPTPKWESAFPRTSITEAGLVAEPIPAGLLVRPADAPAAGPNDAAFAVPQSPGNPRLVLGRAGDAPIDPRRVAQLARRLPVNWRPQIEYVPSSPESGSAARMQQLAELLGNDVLAATGLLIHDGAERSITHDGERGSWRPLPVTLRYPARGAAQVVLSAPPPQGWVSAGPALYRRADSRGSDDVLARVLPGGLLLVTASQVGRPSPADGIAFDPRRLVVALGAPSAPLPPTLPRTLRLLLDGLTSQQRSRVELLVLGPADARMRTELATAAGDLAGTLRYSDAPAQNAGAQKAPAQNTPAQKTPGQNTPAQNAPAQKTPTQSKPAQNTPAQNASAQQAPAQNAPGQNAPAQNAPGQNASGQSGPASDHQRTTTKIRLPGPATSVAAEANHSATPTGSNPDSPKPDAAKPASAKPDAGNRDAGKPDAAKSASSTPEGAKSETAKPAAPKPEPAQPAGSKPGGAGTEAANPAAPKPEGARSEAANPAAPKTEAAKSASPKPEGAKSEAANPAPSKPDTAQPAGPKPEAAKPASPKPEGAKSEAAESAAPKPGTAEPAGPKPEAAKPVSPKPEAAGSEAPKPDTAKPKSISVTRKPGTAKPKPPQSNEPRGEQQTPDRAQSDAPGPPSGQTPAQQPTTSQPRAPQPQPQQPQESRTPQPQQQPQKQQQPRSSDNGPQQTPARPAGPNGPNNAPQQPARANAPQQQPNPQQAQNSQQPPNPQQARNPQQPQTPQQPQNPQQARKPQSPQQAQNLQQARNPQQAQNPQQPRNPQQAQYPQQPQNPQQARNPQQPQPPKNPQQATTRRMAVAPPQPKARPATTSEPTSTLGNDTVAPQPVPEKPRPAPEAPHGSGPREPNASTAKMTPVRPAAPSPEPAPEAGRDQNAGTPGIADESTEVLAPVQPPGPTHGLVRASVNESAVPHDHHSTKEERSRFAELAGTDFDEALPSVNGALATFPALREHQDETAKSDFVAVCLYLQANENGAGTLNQGLRGGDGARFHDYVACLTSGLRRLPVHRGPSFRLAASDESALDGYESGDVLCEPGFVSATGANDLVAPDNRLDVVIWSHSARRVAPFARDGLPEEVVFTAASRFKVLAVDGTADDAEDGSAPAVLMREVRPHETATPGELDETDLSVLPRLRRSLKRRHSAELRTLTDSDQLNRIADPVGLIEGELAGASRAVPVAAASATATAR